MAVLVLALAAAQAPRAPTVTSSWGVDLQAWATLAAV